MGRFVSFAVIAAWVSTSFALSIKFAQDISLRLESDGSLGQSAKAQLESAVNRARARCLNFPDDLVITIEEVVAHAPPLTDRPATRIVSDFIRTLGVSENRLFQGPLSLKDARERSMDEVRRRAIEPGAIEVQIVCTPKA
jgi:hypothetical protein